MARNEFGLNKDKIIEEITTTMEVLDLPVGVETPEVFNFSLSALPVVVASASSGEMTLDDFREFENAVASELEQFDYVNIVFDLSNMTGFSLDAALEEVRFNKAHANDYKKIAVVTESQWLAWVSWFATAFVSFGGLL